MTPKKIVGEVKYKENLAADVWLVRIALDRKAEFVPGQYVSLKVDVEGVRRSYSVASLPGSNSIDLIVDVSPMGVGSKYIMGLKTGDEVELISFLGRFTIDPDLLPENSEVLMVATGTGIAPLRPMIEDLLKNKNYKGKVHLLWGMRYEKDLYWLKEIENIHRDYDNLDFKLILSQPGEGWPGPKGHVGDLLESMSVDWKDTLAYLCGAPKMVEEINKILIGKGVPDEKIFFERYS